MIANNENGRPTETRSVTPPVVIATAGRGAVNHSVQYRHTLPRGATPYETTDALLAGIREHDGEPLVCPCHDDPFGNGPCVECRAEIDAMLVRRGLKAPEGGYFVDSRDGEARDEPEDVT